MDPNHRASGPPIGQSPRLSIDTFLAAWRCDSSPSWAGGVVRTVGPSIWTPAIKGFRSPYPGSAWTSLYTLFVQMRYVLTPFLYGMRHTLDCLLWLCPRPTELLLLRKNRRGCRTMSPRAIAIWYQCLASCGSQAHFGLAHGCIIMSALAPGPLLQV